MIRRLTLGALLAALMTLGSLAAPAMAGIGVISFVSSRDGNPEVYLMNQDGSAQARLTFTDAAETWPAISPDGSKIAFFSNRSGQWNLHLMDLDGSNVVQLTAGLPHDTAAGFTTAVIDWHPDGTRILFNVRVSGVWQLFTVAPDGAGLTQLTFGSLDTHYARYSQDGSGIHAMRNTPFNGFTAEVWVGNPDGTGFVQLTSTTTGIQASRYPAAIATSTGDQVLFARTESRSDQLFHMNPDGSAQTPIPNAQVCDTFPMAPRDSLDRLVFNTCAGVSNITTIRIDGSKRTALTTDGLSSMPYWSFADPDDDDDSDSDSDSDSDPDGDSDSDSD